MDAVEEWYETILAKASDEADEVVRSILAATQRNENGCLVTPTKTPRKVRFQGGQDRAYRFVYCISNQLAPTSHQVVRHRCHNRRCVNPDHLELGDRYENLLDERERRANGIDWSLV